MVLEEYGPELIYIKGPDNIVADALSRLDLIPDPPAVDSNILQTDVDGPATDVKGHDKESNAITLVCKWPSNLTLTGHAAYYLVHERTWGFMKRSVTLYLFF